MATRDLELFVPYNRTELIQACQDAGISVSPSVSREELIGLLVGAIEEPSEPSEIDAWRHGIMGFILDHWAILSTQLTCPAKTKDPRACFGCIDTQVISCLNSNKQYIDQIAYHKREERTHSMSTENQPLMIETAPRTLEALTAVPFTDLRRLVKQLEGKGIHLEGDDEGRRAFYTTKDTHARAQKVLELLQRFDAQNAPTPAAAAPAVPKRTPAARKAAADKESTVAAVPAAEGGATQLVDLSPIMEALKVIMAGQAEQAKMLEELRGRTEALGALSEITLGTTILVAEHTTNCGKEGFFVDAVTAATEMHDLMEEANRGK